MAFMLWPVPADAPLPEALEPLGFLAKAVGVRATIFLAGWAIWTLVGMVSMSRLAIVVARNQQQT